MLPWRVVQPIESQSIVTRPWWNFNETRGSLFALLRSHNTCDSRGSFGYPSLLSEQLSSAGRSDAWSGRMRFLELTICDMEQNMVLDLPFFHWLANIFSVPANSRTFLPAWRMASPWHRSVSVAEYILKEHISDVTFPPDTETELPTTLIYSVTEKAAKIPHSCTVRSS